MTYISQNMIRNYLHFVVLYILAVLCVLHPYPVNAQDTGKQILSVTPPLFQLSVLPGDVWQSSIKVVNGNPYPLTVYPELVNFSATGEAGQGKFLSIEESGGNNSTLAEWISIPSGPYIIPSEQTKDISFFVEAPKDASPGGHYAAILISTEPPNDDSGFSVKTSQAVTALLFMRVEGDVNEEGSIREFRAIDSFLDTPEATFSLRFENKGNVHLQPRGNVVITNMWGTERGVIPINYQTHFGNVLPQSIRDFNLTWKSDFSITDIGRYKAIVTLGYGENGIKSASAITYFWVIPVKWTLITIAILATFIALIVIMVKAYIRRMLMLAGVDVSKQRNFENEGIIKTPDVKMKQTYTRVSEPLRSGVLDLRTRLTTAEESVDIVRTVMSFIILYKWFFISICILILIFVSVTTYISKATEADKQYQVTVDEGGGVKVLDDADVETLMQE